MPYKDQEKQRAAWRRYEKIHAEKRRAAKHERQRALARRFQEFKKGLRCARCPENHPACIEFHHLDARKKDYNLADLARHGCSWEKIMKEVEKCEVLCANCHRKAHAKRLRGVAQW